MATFDPTGSTLKSVTLEAAVMEVSQLLQNTESASDNPGNNIAVNYDTGDNVVQIQAVMPFEQTIAASGQTQFVGTNYIAATWSSGGDVQSANLAAATVELLQKLQIKEKSLAENPNNVTISYDTETLLATINATLPIEFLVSNSSGRIEIVAVPYLTD